jgi:hypothetical protein
MALHKDQIHAINGAVWLFGLAALFYTRATRKAMREPPIRSKSTSQLIRTMDRG